jgi:hypothetical protein
MTDSEPIILPDEKILAVGIDQINVVIGGFNVFGHYDYDGEVNGFKFQFGYEWQYSSIKEIEVFIQAELSKELCPVH